MIYNFLQKKKLILYKKKLYLKLKQIIDKEIKTTEISLD